jgi:hypothetical protein
MSDGYGGSERTRRLSVFRRPWMAGSRIDTIRHNLHGCHSVIVPTVESHLCTGPVPTL